MQRSLGRMVIGGFLAVLPLFAGGCPNHAASVNTAITAHSPGFAKLTAVDFSDASELTPLDRPLALAGARNEWTSFTVQIDLPAASGFSLRVHPPIAAGVPMPLSSFRIYQALSMPIDMNRAGYVRHTGQPALQRTLPRALLALTLNAGGVVDLAALRNPARPVDPRSRAGGPGSQPALLWFDLRVPKGIAAGDYAGSIDLVGPGNAKPQSALPFKLTVADFDLPDERHLQMVGQLSWDRLEKLYAGQFEAFTPSWINRREGRYQATVRTLDHLIALAQENRANLTVPALKPVVKWPAGEGPQIEWLAFDSMVRPWLSGDAFSDRVGLTFWPMPQAEMLDRFDLPSRLQYWEAACTHFDANEWLAMTAIVLKNSSAGPHAARRATLNEAIDISAEAAQILKCYPRVKTIVPLEDNQLQLAGADNPAGIDPAQVSRLVTASATLVSTSARRPWGEAVPRHWLPTDVPGLVPFFGAGASERDARVWAWLAFLRHLDTYGVSHVFEPNSIAWNTTLPLANTPTEPADPGELVWFYPGEWFGVDLPLPTVQLKWLRQAEQDYEYLLMAQDRGEQRDFVALELARLIVKPVELEVGQFAQPVYTLMTGATDPQAWINARQLLSDAIALHQPGQKTDVTAQHDLEIRTLQLSAPLEHPVLMARGAAWSFADAAPGQREAGTWVNLDLGLDIYNASENTPDRNQLRWSKLPAGWQIKPQETVVPILETYHVLPATLDQKFNLDRLAPFTNESREPMELEFVDGFSKRTSTLKIVLPIAASNRREAGIKMNATLADWGTADAIWDGPMVKMLNRPAVQRQELQWSATRSNLFTSWGMENFYVAFAVDGLAPRPEQGKNFVDYEDRRAWGEDLCEILIQPILPDNSLAPAVHIVVKPTGGVWVERKSPKGAGNAIWQPVESACIRYVATTPESLWRGEIAIPWSALLGLAADRAAAPIAAPDLPKLLRFNFTQHKSANGESASWAGPIDFGRDEAFMGLIYLKAPGQ